MGDGVTYVVDEGSEPGVAPTWHQFGRVWVGALVAATQVGPCGQDDGPQSGGAGCRYRAVVAATRRRVGHHWMSPLTARSNPARSRERTASAGASPPSQVFGVSNQSHTDHPSRP